MSSSLEIFGKGLAPDRENVESILTASVQEKRKALAGLSVESEPKMIEWLQYLRDKYGAVWKTLGGRELFIPLYFIPLSQRSEVEKILERPTPTDQAFHIQSIRSVIIFIPEGNLANLHTARLVSHELAHAWSGGFERYQHSYDEETNRFNVSLIASGTGVSMTTESGQVGNFFEEWYAVEQEQENLPELQKRFPEENALAENGVNQTVKAGVILPEAAPYTSVYNNDLHEIRSVTAYANAHPLCSEILKKIPDGKNLITKARFSGKWTDLARVVDQVFGPRTFKVIAHTNPIDKEACRLLKEYLDARSQEEKSQLEKQILGYAKNSQGSNY